MSSTVLLPWHDLAVPDGLRALHYDATEGPPADLSEVEFYVLPYDSGPEPARLMASMPSLRVVQSLNAGVDDLLPRLPDGVRLANGRGLHDLSVAEHAMALILAAQRELPRWLARQRQRVWDHAHTASLADSTVLLVGYGAISKAIERYLDAGEANVVRVASTAREGVHALAELPELLPAADIVVLVLPDTPSTRGVIGAAELAALPDGALLVNVGRGTAVDTGALTDAVAAGRVRAALDVTDPEPLPADHPLWTFDGVLITPHVAGGSASFHPRARSLVQRQLAHYAAGEPLENVVR